MIRRFFALLTLAAAAYSQQPNALLPAKDATELFKRSLQLIESTAAAVPGLSRAAAPVMENARQAQMNLEAGTIGAATLTYDLLLNVRAYLALAESVPKPYPFPEEGKKQFAELRDDVDRIESHFRAMIDQNEKRLRNPDRDNLRRYAEADQTLLKPTADQKRIVFLGDSITDGWRLNEYFPGRDFVNRGISGQVTGEMLGRMKADVIDIKPSAVLILAGTNDIARGTPLSTIENNLTMIADLADVYRIKPIFASVLPISDYHKDVNPRYEMSKQRSPAAIIELNRWIQALCSQRRYQYVDYFSQMVDPSGYMKADLADDGLHPNSAGYRVMGPIAMAAIDRHFAPAATPAPTAPAPVSKKRAPRPVQAAATPPAPKPPPVVAAAPPPKVTSDAKPAPIAKPKKEVKTEVAKVPVVDSAAEAKKAEAKAAEAKRLEAKAAAAKLAEAKKAEAKVAEAKKAEQKKDAEPKKEKVPFWKRTYPTTPPPAPQ